MAMTRAQFRKQLQDGLNTVFGMEYKRKPEQWKAMFAIEKSDKAYEEDQMLVGLGGARIKPEGSAISYDEGGEAWTARYHHDTIGLAFAITEEAMEDNLYGDIGAKYSKSLANSLVNTKEVSGASVFNDGFSTFTTGDGVSLFNTAHPLYGGGTFSNTLATAADLSEASLEDATIQISQYVDDRGIPIHIGVRKLIVPNGEMYVAHRILNSQLRVGTADNDPNAMREMGAIPEGYATNRYFSDSKSWLLVTDCPDGAKHFQRRPVKRGIEGDFETGNMRYKATERYKFGVTNPRGLYGVQGE